MLVCAPLEITELEDLAARLKEHGAKEDLMESRKAFAEKRPPRFTGRSPFSTFTGTWPLTTTASSVMPKSAAIRRTNAARYRELFAEARVPPELVLPADVDLAVSAGHVLLLVLIFYVTAVISTMLFGQSFPEWFGTLPPPGD